MRKFSPLILFILIGSICTYGAIVDNIRINRAEDKCQINCGKTNYDCRDKCFSYEYYNR